MSPSQATPSTQIQALMPDLKVAALAISEASILVKVTMAVAAASINTMMASLRPSVGFSMILTASEISVA